LQFTAYEELKKLTVTHLADGDEKQLGPHHFLAMGAAAKVVASTLTFPLSVTRSRLYQRKPDRLLMTMNTTATAPSLTGAGSEAATSAARVDMKYRNMRHVMSSIISSDGYRGFYRGLVPHLMKTTPSSAITFLCYESVLRIIGANDNVKSF
jgi:solute carrier family 25 folate transporter 32